MPLNISSKREKSSYRCSCGCPMGNGCPVNTCAMSKFCYGCVVVGVEARAWHFPSLGQMVPDGLPSGTGLTYPVVPPHPNHPFSWWVLGPSPSTRQTPSGYSLCCWSSLGTQLPEGLGPPVSQGTGAGSTDNTPASPKGHCLHLCPPSTFPPVCVLPSTWPVTSLPLCSTQPHCLRRCQFAPKCAPSILWESKESHLQDTQPLINWATGITMIATANNPNSHSNASQVSTLSHVCPQTLPGAWDPC